jgi:hypothetical protein
MIDRKILGLSFAAITLAALLLTIGSGIAVAQVVASATGSGHFRVSGDLRTLTFNANTDSAGGTTGQTQGNNRNAGVLSGTAQSLACTLLGMLPQ